MLGKLFLAAVGLLYLGLALWCSFAPATTAGKVGFTLNGDSGRSEFITVYGGLEFAMALIFLAPFVRAEWLSFSLMSCLLIHLSLVGFRTLSFLGNSNVEPLTMKLAAGEWVILLASIAVVYLSRK